MLLKVEGVLVALGGLVMLIFTVMTWLELRTATASELPPTAVSMPLTKLVYPQLFRPVNAAGIAVDPAELARSASNRIYIIGGGSFILVVVGMVMLVLPRNSQTGQNGS